MKEFFEVINEYPWSTFWICVFILLIVEQLTSCIKAVILGKMLKNKQKDQ